MTDPSRLLEALLFASADPVPAAAIARALPPGTDPGTLLAELRTRYAGRGVELHEVAGAWHFRTAPDLVGDLAPLLARTRPQPRRLSRATMEVLAAIAYHGPCTRAEIEALRGATLSQSTVDALLEAALIEPRGRKEAPGRPTLWVTTDRFLSQFGLRSLQDLPRREDLLVEPP